MNPSRNKHPKQEVSGELVGKLMGIIRGQFCGDVPAKEWAQLRDFILRNVVLWPARFITKKRFSITGERYEEIMMEIFDGIKRNGTQGAIRRWPGYLMKCVQSHFEINWETYYSESKSVRNMALHAVATLGKIQQEDKTVETLAMAQRVLCAKKEKNKKIADKKPAINSQLTMFDF